jgi:Tol biopolymer transport system component
MNVNKLKQDHPPSKIHAKIALSLLLAAAFLWSFFGCQSVESRRATPFPPVSTAPRQVPTPIPEGSPAAEAPPLSGRITFHSDRNGDFDIYVMNADGSNLKRLTTDPGKDVEPAWSPDGNRIAFSSNRDGDYEIFIMKADGSELVQLTDNNFNDWAPDWSPDGNRLVFASNREGPNRLYLMDANGANQRPLASAGAGDGWAPSWSPNGQEIVFVSKRDGNSELYLIDIEGDNVRRLTNNDLQDERPTWSPDGAYILYMAAKTRTSLFDPDEIFIMPREGEISRQLTDNLIGDITPTWSPDGNWIAFSSNRDSGDWEIYVMRADGSGEPRRLTDVPGWDREPDWGP